MNENKGINRANNRASLETELFYYIKTFPLLTKEQELWEFRKPKEKMDRTLIINSNLRLVYKIAKKYESEEHSAIELMGSGVEGLNKAIDKFDHNKYTNRFFTYAYNWVLCYIIQAIKSDSVIKNVKKGSIISAEFLLEDDTLQNKPYNCPLQIDNELLECLNNILPPDLLYILIQNVINGLSAKKIAEELNLSMRQVYYRINQAKTLVKNELGLQNFKNIINYGEVCPINSPIT